MDVPLFTHPTKPFHRTAEYAKEWYANCGKWKTNYYTLLASWQPTM